MKFPIHLTLIGLLLFTTHDLFAQTDTDLQPRSFNLSQSLSADPSAVLLAFDSSQVGAMDMRDEKDGNMPRFARTIATNIDLRHSGTWTTLDGGGRLWQCKISSPGALALIPCFDRFFIPSGAMLHVYTPDREEVIGAFTSINNPANGRYNTGLVHGDQCILEYYEPAEVAGAGILHINEIGHAYRMVPKRKSSRSFGDAASCEVNVACSEGAAWQDQKNAVVRMLVKLGNEFGWCSATLMNNVNQDCTPYILSADHCYQNGNNNYVAATAADMDQWVFYFNYESVTCANPAAEGTLASHFLVGCIFMAASQDNGGDNGSDFVLVRMNSYVPALYHPYYAGWSRLDVTSTSGVCIHQPNADIKKISTYSNPLIPSHWGTLTLNTHWQVQWDVTTNGDGVTEPGSSGAPIFNSNKLVIGHLTGGSSSCQGPNNNDLFGKVSYDWSSNGSTADKHLSTYLDPNGSGATTLSGTYGSCAANVGIHDVRSGISEISIYPNPSTGIYHVVNNQSDVKLTVTDAIGRYITGTDISGHTTGQIDLSAEQSGIYFFHMVSGQGFVTRKVTLHTGD